VTLSPPVEIWTADFSGFAGTVEHLLERLSADERARLAPAREGALRSRSVLRRTMLRSVLGDACSGSVQFTYGRHGKPALAAPGSPSFSISHAGPLSILAVHAGGLVGVDVAEEQPIPGLEALVARVFSPEEQSRFAGLPPALRLRSFYRAWTLKEALLKAVGTGLTLEPNLFEVEIDPLSVPRLVASRTPLIEPARWELHVLDAPEPYHAVIAVERSGGIWFRYHRFDVHSLGPSVPLTGARRQEGRSS
jgi:4'-phosphopantetheinyl transferase